MNFMEELGNAPAELMLNNDLTGTSKNLWIIINGIAGEHGLVATNKEIGETIGIDGSTIGRALKLLESLGYVKVETIEKQRVLSVNPGYVKRYRHIKERFEKFKQEHDDNNKRMLDEALEK